MNAVRLGDERRLAAAVREAADHDLPPCWCAIGSATVEELGPPFARTGQGKMLEKLRQAIVDAMRLGTRGGHAREDKMGRRRAVSLAVEHLQANVLLAHLSGVVVCLELADRVWTASDADRIGIHQHDDVVAEPGGLLGEVFELRRRIPLTWQVDDQLLQVSHRGIEPHVMLAQPLPFCTDATLNDCGICLVWSHQTGPTRCATCIGKSLFADSNRICTTPSRDDARGNHEQHDRTETPRSRHGYPQTSPCSYDGVG